MNWRDTPEQTPSDAGLVARLTQVEEDGPIWGPKASNVTTCRGNMSLYQKIHDSVHEQYRPRTAYCQRIADRIAETIWCAERYASVETTALSHQTALNSHKFGNPPIKPTVSAHDWHAWLALEGPARKALLEALKLADQAWRRHRALAAELRTVQGSVFHEVAPGKRPTPAPFEREPGAGPANGTEIENEPIRSFTQPASAPSGTASVRVCETISLRENRQ